MFSSEFRRLWGWPLLLGLLTASGLFTALVSDHWGDVWSWVALGIPVGVMGWFGWRRTPADSDGSPSGSATGSATATATIETAPATSALASFAAASPVQPHARGTAAAVEPRA